MRYKVQFNPRDTKFQVLDADNDDNVVGTFATAEQARTYAIRQEQRWFEGSAADAGGAWPKDIAAV